MIKLTNVLVPIDFSEHSRAALDEARAIAEPFGARLHLLNVTEPFHEVWVSYAPGADFIGMMKASEAATGTRLAHLRTPQEAIRERVVIATTWGDPSDEILKYAREHAVDLIVCGTHGRTGWERLLIGSVAERIVRFAPCPVLTVSLPPRETLAESFAVAGLPEMAEGIAS